MQPVTRKQHKPMKHGRWLMLAGVMVLLGASIGVWYTASRPEETVVVETASRGGTLYACEEADVASLRITLRSDESWVLTQDEDGNLAVDGNSSYQVAERKRLALLEAAAAVTYEDILTEDASAYAENFADFGLDDPRVVAEIVYRDGTAMTLRIGNYCAMDDTGWSYMTVEGDPRLYALDNGTADALAEKKADLHPVEQPVLHQARFDRVTLTGENGEIHAQWQLQGEIGNDADDRWLLTKPVTYPADGTSMANLHDNLENIRLGSYVCEATEENLALYGFESPRFVIDIHMAAGSIGTTNADGEFEVTDWPESSFTLTVGKAKSNEVDYVCVENSIYLTSHFSLATFMNMEPANTLTRYIVPAALGNLAQLDVVTADEAISYVLTRTEQVAENNDLVYDEDGNIVYDISCTRNGEAISYASFEAAYNELLVATVSGNLPSGWVIQEEPHSRCVFTQTDGTVHTVELSTYDAFHDAVSLNGHAMFYLIKDGMKFDVE